MLAALPPGARSAGPTWVSILVLATPYLAGLFAGIVTVRITPTPVIEAAALWGFVAGAATGAVTGLAAAFAGGPLGDGRLATVGPSGWQVGLVATLEIGVTAALTAAAATWLMFRRAQGRVASPRAGGSRGVAPPGVTAVIDETDDIGGHRIYVNPWAGEEEDPEDELPAVLRDADLVAD
jgi:hypothetical protein